MPDSASPDHFDEARHPRGQPDNPGKFRSRTLPEPPPARRKRRRGLTHSMRVRFIPDDGLYGFDRTVQVLATGRHGMWELVATYVRVKRGHWRCRSFPFSIDTATESEMRRRLRLGLKDRDALIEEELER